MRYPLSFTIFIILEEKIKTVFLYIICDSFDYHGVFKICFNQRYCNFEDVSKIGWSGFS